MEAVLITLCKCTRIIEIDEVTPILEIAISKSLCALIDYNNPVKKDYYIRTFVFACFGGGGYAVYKERMINDNIKK
jgi:hypothetical protein